MASTTPPGDRRPRGTGRHGLERPPAERYAATTVSAAGPAARRATVARALVLGEVAALAGTVAIVVLGGVFSVTAGLLVVAGVIGWAVGRVVRTNAAGLVPPTLRSMLGAVLAVDALVLGQVGLWAWALAQGGTLDLVAYLAETRGVLVPVELVIAVAVAWWSAR